MKKYGLTGVLIFVSWFILDYVIHQLILGSAYQATKELWRPPAEMKMWLMWIVSILVIIILIYMYDKLVANKSLNKGLLFGLLYGLATGLSMGYGTYSVQPITYGIALTWFLGTVVEMVVAGLWLGLFVKDETAA